MKKEIIPHMYLFEGNDTVQSVYISEHHFEKYDSHSHDFYEFEYALEGNGVCEINGTEYPFNKGDICFVTPLDIHRYRGNEKFRVLTVHFRIVNLNHKLMDLNGINACVIKSNESISSGFEMLRKADANDELYDLFCEKVLESIVIMFLQMIKRDRKKVFPKEINFAVEYININFKKEITLKTISEKVGYSSEHFSRQFKKYTGVTFLHYLTDVRLAYARHLLEHQHMTVTQACFESGFGCLRSFSRAFKRKYGYSPKFL